MVLGMRNDTPPTSADEMDAAIDSVLDDDIEIIYDADLEDYVETYHELDDSPSESEPDQSNLTFKGHSGPVFCCTLDNSIQHAVTGGEDDKAFVWNPNTGETILECTGHADSVIFVGFNHDCTLVATADMSGLVQVWDVQKKECSCSFTASSDIRWLEWHPHANVLLTGTSAGEGNMWRVPNGDVKILPPLSNDAICGRIMPDGLRSVIGYSDGSIRFWDLKKATVIHSTTGHPKHAISLDCHPDNVLVAVGFTSGIVRLVKSTTGKVLGTLECSSNDDTSAANIGEADMQNDSVECVSFFPSHPTMLATSTVCGNLSIWDVPTERKRQQCKLSDGIVKHVCNKDSPLIYTADLGGTVRLYDGRSGQFERDWHGHTHEILDISLSRDGGTILTSSEDKTCKIFKVNQS